MKKPGIEELLIRSILEPQLLQQLTTAPESVFEDYELSERAREILASPDERLLELLGEVVGSPKDESPAERAEATVAPTEPGVAVTALPASRLAVRLVPYVQQAPPTADDAPAVLVNYAGHLDPLPEDAELTDLPDVPAAVTDGQQLPPVSVVVSVQPTVWTDDSGNQQMTFAVSAQVPQGAAVSPSGSDDGARLSPWPHDVDSPAVVAAASSVHDAEAGDRYDRLRELIDVMVAPPESPGAAQ